MEIEEYGAPDELHYTKDQLWTIVEADWNAMVGMNSCTVTPVPRGLWFAEDITSR